MKILCDKQYDEVWWEHRRGLPTASEFDRIVTAAKCELSNSADKYAFQLIGDGADPNYLQRVTGNTFATSAMKTGTVMEPAARHWVESYLGPVTQTGLLCTDCGRFGCSPDGLLDGGNVGLELKSPNPQAQVEYLYYGVMPTDYRPQVHGHLIVGGFKSVEFVSFVRGLPVFHVHVEPDEYTEKLRAALELFWNRIQEIRKVVCIA